MGMAAPSNGDLLGGMMGGAPPAMQGRGRAATASQLPVGGGGVDLMGDLMGVGGGGGGRANASIPEPAGGGDRAFFAQRREAEKQAAIAEKVNALKAQKDLEESNREKERDLEKVVKAKVGQWQKEKKNLRALLASLHEIAPPCSWQPMNLGQLLEPSAVKKAYRKALLAVHPDKQKDTDVEAKVLAQHVFDALRDAWNLFEKTG